MNIKEILKKHEMWLKNDIGGECANLCSADLRGVDLHSANLCGADLFDADLCGANLCRINLCGANLCGAELYSANMSYADLRDVDLCYADLRGADLHDADLCYADLSGVNLCGANLCGANLYGTNLCGANLHGADLRDTNLCGANLCGVNLCGAKNVDELKWSIYTAFYPLQCPEEGEYIAWKKAHNKIIKLKITEKAKRSSATSRKCRASEALVLDIQSIDGTKHFDFVSSDRDDNFVYRIGEIVQVDDFDENRWNECSNGIHHFITREEAVKYN